MAQAFGAAVATAIVDVENLVRRVERFEHAHQLLVQGRDALDLVVDEHDHRKPRRHGGCMPRTGSHPRIVSLSPPHPVGRSTRSAGWGAGVTTRPKSIN